MEWQGHGCFQRHDAHSSHEEFKESFSVAHVRVFPTFGWRDIIKGVI